MIYASKKGIPLCLSSLPIIRLVDDLPMPQRAHHDDAGVDLYSAETLMVEPGQRALLNPPHA